MPISFFVTRKISSILSFSFMSFINIFFILKSPLRIIYSLFQETTLHTALSLLQSEPSAHNQEAFLPCLYLHRLSAHHRAPGEGICFLPSFPHSSLSGI